jgi:hypothetical protein
MIREIMYILCHMIIFRAPYKSEEKGVNKPSGHNLYKDPTTQLHHEHDDFFPYNLWFCQLLIILDALCWRDSDSYSWKLPRIWSMKAKPLSCGKSIPTVI